MISFRVSDVQIFADVVLESIEDAERRVLKIVGYETRADAMQSIVPGPSRAGQPPRDKTGDLRRHINYSLDGKTIVIGARPLAKKSVDVLPSLESGGISYDVHGNRHYIEKRPFMGPALNRIARRLLPGLFLDSVHPKG